MTTRKYGYHGWGMSPKEEAEYESQTNTETKDNKTWDDDYDTEEDNYPWDLNK